MGIEITVETDKHAMCVLRTNNTSKLKSPEILIRDKYNIYQIRLFNFICVIYIVDVMEMITNDS